MRVARWSVLVGLWLVSLSQLHAAAPPAEPASTPDPAPIRDLETLVVHGVQPGPGLWKVSKDDHVLWILGTASPLPDRIQWQSGEVEAIVARSQQVLLPPSQSVTSAPSPQTGNAAAPAPLHRRPGWPAPAPPPGE